MLRAWSSVQLKETKHLVDRLALIGSVDHDKGTVQGIGTGFVVADARGVAGNTVALVCTAAHLIVEAEMHLIPMVREQRSSPFAPLPGHRLLNLPFMRGLKVFLWHRDVLQALNVLQGCICADSDLACLSIASGGGDDKREGPPKIFTINSDPLTVGDEVVAVGAPQFELEIEEWTRNGPVHVKGLAGINLRRGSIAASLNRGRLARVPVYETTIPLPGGFSGGPVLRYSPEGRFMNSVVGIVSSDLPDDDSASNYDRPGCSYVVPAQYLHMLKAPNFDDPSKEGILAQRGISRTSASERVSCMCTSGEIPFQ